MKTKRKKNANGWCLRVLLLLACALLFPYKQADRAWAQGNIANLTVKLIDPNGNPLTKSHYRYTIKTDIGAKTCTWAVTDAAEVDVDPYNPSYTFFLPANFELISSLSTPPYPYTANQDVIIYNSDFGLNHLYYEYDDNTKTSIVRSAAADYAADMGNEKFCYIKRATYTIKGGTNPRTDVLFYSIDPNVPSYKNYKDPGRVGYSDYANDNNVGKEWPIYINNNFERNGTSFTLDCQGDIELEITLELAAKEICEFTLQGFADIEVHLFSLGAQNFYKPNGMQTSGWSIGTINDAAHHKLIWLKDGTHSAEENCGLLIAKTGEAAKGLKITGIPDEDRELLIKSVRFDNRDWYVVFLAPGMGTISPGTYVPTIPKYEISYLPSGVGYTGLKVTDNSGDVPSGSPRERGTMLTITATPTDACKTISGYEVEMGGSTQAITHPFSFTLSGIVNSITPILSDIQTQVSATSTNIEVEGYTLPVTIPCGTSLTVKVTPTDICQELDGSLVALQGSPVPPTPIGSTNPDGSKSYTITAGGHNLTLFQAEKPKTLSVVWAGGAFYSLQLKSNGSLLTSSPAPLNCGAPLEVTATATETGREITAITIVYVDDSRVPLVLSGSGLAKSGSIASVEKSIKAIEVQQGVPPSTISYERQGVGYTLEVQDDAGNPITSGEKVELNDMLKFVFTLDKCYDYPDNTSNNVTIHFQDGTTDNLSITSATPYLYRFQKTITAITAEFPQKRFTIQGVAMGLTLKRADEQHLDLNSVECDALLVIDKEQLDDCEAIGGFTINGGGHTAPQFNSTFARWEFVIAANISSITYNRATKQISASWTPTADYSIEVAPTSGGASLKPKTTENPDDGRMVCGTSYTITATSTDPERPITSVTIAFDDGSQRTFSQGDFASSVAEGSKITVEHIPTQSIVSITATLGDPPTKFTITFSNTAEYTIEVSYYTGGAPIGSGNGVNEGTRIAVVVTPLDAARKQVKGVSASGTELTYDEGRNCWYFDLKGNVTITPTLEDRLYTLRYTAWQDGQLEVRRREPTGPLLEPGQEHYLRYEEEVYVKGTPSNPNEHFIERYTYNGGKPITDSHEQQWYSFKVTEDVTSIEVVLTQLGAEQCRVSYNDRPTVYGAPVGTVDVLLGSQRLEPNGHTVSYDATLIIKINIAPGYQPVCITVNEKLEELALEGTEFSLQIKQRRHVYIEVHFAEKVKAPPVDTRYFLTLREPTHGALEMYRVGQSPDLTLSYERTYRVRPNDAYKVRLKPFAEYEVGSSSEELEPFRDGAEGDFVVATREDPRIALWVTFTPLLSNLSVRYSHTAGGTLTASTARENPIPASSYQQRGITVSFDAQAEAGYYLARFDVNGENTLRLVGGQPDTTIRALKTSRMLSGDLTVHAAFERIPRKDSIISAIPNSLADLRVYPTPSRDFITVEDASLVVGYRLYDLSGRTLLAGRHQGDALLRIDISRFASGLYFIHLEARDGSLQTLRIIKE